MVLEGCWVEDFGMGILGLYGDDVGIVRNIRICGYCVEDIGMRMLG